MSVTLTSVIFGPPPTNITPFFSSQVTTLVSQKGPSSKKKGRSKKAHVLSAAVQKATENFVQKGEEIANENPDIKPDMIAAVEEVKKTGTVICSMWGTPQKFLKL